MDALHLLLHQFYQKSNNLLVHVDWFWWIQDNSGGFEIKGFGANMHISIVFVIIAGSTVHFLLHGTFFVVGALVMLTAR